MNAPGQIFLLALMLGLPFEARPADAPVRLLESSQSELRAEDGKRFMITRGRIQVAELHREQSQAPALIELAFVRVHRAEVPTQAAHIVLAGGPGESGVKLVLGLAHNGGAMLDELFDADIIGLDQRGTGASSPSLAITARIDLPLDQPASEELWQPILRDAVGQAKHDLAQRGIRAEAYNTRESADDLDDLRRLLGYRQLSLWGRSYGSHLALAYARAYPEYVQRMVLVSPEGPDHTWKLPMAADQVLETIESRPGGRGLIRNMQKVFARLRKQPVTVRTIDPIGNREIAITIGALDLQWITANALTDAHRMATLPQAYRRMAKDDYSALAPIALMYRQRVSLQSAMKHLMNASSGATLERRAKIRAQARTSLLGDALNFPWMALESDWATADLGDQFRAPLVSAAPTLILVGELDVNTPVANAHELAGSMPNARQIVVVGAAHQFDLFGSRNLRHLLRDFLEGNLPAQASVQP